MAKSACGRGKGSKGGAPRHSKKAKSATQRKARILTIKNCIRKRSKSSKRRRIEALAKK